jgi:hypothetical protein
VQQRRSATRPANNININNGSNISSDDDEPVNDGETK